MRGTLRGSAILLALSLTLVACSSEAEPTAETEPTAEAEPTLEAAAEAEPTSEAEPTAEAASSPITVGGHPLFGEEAPEIDLETFDGERLTLSSLRGQPVLINFWATWCGPCREEFPLMIETYAARADDGLEILGILHDDTVEGGRAFAADMGAEWPMLYDADDVAWDDYLGLGKPTSFFVDPDGIIRAFSLGPFSEEGLERQLATIIPEA